MYEYRQTPRSHDNSTNNTKGQLVRETVTRYYENGELVSETVTKEYSDDKEKSYKGSDFYPIFNDLYNAVSNLSR